MGVRGKLFLERLVVKHSSRLPHEVVKPPPLGGFQNLGGKGPEQPDLILKTPVLSV